MEMLAEVEGVAGVESGMSAATPGGDCRVGIHGQCRLCKMPLRPKLMPPDRRFKGTPWVYFNEFHVIGGFFTTVTVEKCQVSIDIFNTISCQI